ncbi:MAG: tRNA preQ1(34) S-adenosylmethionine ribosyltransferase-isomerase QueA [Pseudomonadota bacterium]
MSRSDDPHRDALPIDLFDFELPEARIALAPTPERDGARLLHVAPGGDVDRTVRDLPRLLRAGDVVVFNNSKVIPAQLAGVRPARTHGGGGDVAVDVTLHKAHPDQDGAALWDAFARPAKRLGEGDVVRFSDDFTARVVARDGATVRLRFNCSGADFRTALQRIGAPPLPPYIARKRATEAVDAQRYQTVYAEREGSVAAPTAGLHFTDRLLAEIDAVGARRVTTTLHVGAGTFLPVTAEDARAHKMHAEWGEVTAEAAGAVNDARAAGGRVVAVGTTAMRLLETAAAADGTLQPFNDETDIFITPGYDFRIVDCLMTNFHLPKSTLFMLVCAFCGIDRMQTAYAHAIARDYRFFSYGDACFLEWARG